MMKYPMISKQPRREVSIPKLSGGLNLRDSLSGIRDNQMSDCVNMWYKNGMLRTRPPFVTNDTMKFNILKNRCAQKMKTHIDIRKGDAVLSSCWWFEEKSDENSDLKSWIEFWWQYDDKIEYAGSISIVLALETENEEDLQKTIDECLYFVTEKDGNIYCYASNAEQFYIYKSEYIGGNSEWVNLNSDEIYIPTVYAHCQRTGWDDFKCTQFEGFNFIGNSYKMIYSAYNENDSDSTHPMRYKLGQKLASSGVIKAEITTYDSSTETMTTIEHSIKYTAEDYESFSNGKVMIERFGEGNTSEDGIRLFVKYNYVGFLFTAIDDGVEGKEFFVAMLDTEEKVRKYGCNEDNVVITAQYDRTDDWKKVFRMTHSIWFGGDANGIYGGSRLFLCGNIEEKSLVVWSGINNPLYFNENNYVYVGDKSQAVTTFGQQGENLIVFKEGSTYYSYYAVNSNITAESLENQTVVDYEANQVYFPMIQLNGRIGCDCPDTVQLCRNRLVWANSDGSVYTLYSNNQYSERTIYKVSDMIYSALCKENDLKNAVSCDFEGHYLLGVGNKIYVMDYNSYGYQYASSFSKTEDSNAQIPWYMWSFENDTEDNGCTATIYEINNKLMLSRNFYTDKGTTITFSTLSENQNMGCDEVLICDPRTNELCLTAKNIKSKMQTKLFDFSLVGYLKSVDRVSVGFGNNNGIAISVSFVANSSVQSGVAELSAPQTNEREASFVAVKNFYPTMRAIRTFGVKIECEGLLIIDGILLQYRLLGGVK